MESYWPEGGLSAGLTQLGTLTNKNCRFLTVYNWENMLAQDPNGIAAVREVIATWKEKYSH